MYHRKNIYNIPKGTLNVAAMSFWTVGIRQTNFDDAGIVWSTGSTLVVKPMEPCSSFSTTVVAKYVLTTIPIFFGQLFRSQQSIKHSKIDRHISQRLAANWTDIVAACISLEASWMHIMATWKSSNWCTWCEEEIATDWAICFQTFLTTFMVNQLHTKAAIASHAMEEVWTKSLSHTTQVAERAMIDTPLIIEKLADVTVIVGHWKSMAWRCCARRSNRLNLTAEHTHHFRRHFPIHGVITNFVVTEPACEQFPAAGSSKFAIPFVMFTAKDLFFRIPVWRRAC